MSREADKQIESTRRRQIALGTAWSIILVFGLGAAMLPLRGHLSVATTALVLVVPVVVGVATGGLVAGIIATAAGFLVYDFVFIPPYYTLSVGQAQNWTALAVYVVVMFIVAQVVARLDLTKAEANRRATEVRRLFDLSELLVRESGAAELLDTIVTTVSQAFDLDGAALLLPIEGRLALAASAGIALSEQELSEISAATQVPVRLGTAWMESEGVQVVPLSPSGQPIGLLVLRGLTSGRKDQDLLRAFANHLALALERSQLREQALRAQLLEEIDRLRRSLVGAVSHDLRTPLATIKVSTSALLDLDAPIAGPDARELVGLIDVQTDRLDRLVSNLLDMTRIQSGALEVRCQPTTLSELLDEALEVLGPSEEFQSVIFTPQEDLPFVNVDHVLTCQVIANLIDNAIRYSPAGAPVIVSAERASNDTIEVSVSDKGPGIPEAERASIFHMFNRREAGGRGGLGLAIAWAFIDAHKERIWVREKNGGGSCFVFTLPIAKSDSIIDKSEIA